MVLFFVTPFYISQSLGGAFHSHIHTLLNELMQILLMEQVTRFYSDRIAGRALFLRESVHRATEKKEKRVNRCTDASCNRTHNTYFSLLPSE